MTKHNKPNLDRAANVLASVFCKVSQRSKLNRHRMTALTLGTGLMFFAGCASIVNDSHVPITLSFSDGSSGTCTIKNKRFTVIANIPGSHSVRRSDDPLHFDCQTDDGRRVSASVDSEIGGVVAGNIILGGFIGGAIDAGTDKHRKYPDSFIIPVPN
jgi:hypothetical protein